MNEEMKKVLIVRNNKVTVIEWSSEKVEYFYNDDTNEEKEIFLSEEIHNDENGDSYFVDVAWDRQYKKDFRLC